jgi:pyruvate/2-oxoglutarate dehydrogenase complex dihydrolipoamide dehydrogenase (E3) component
MSHPGLHQVLPDDEHDAALLDQVHPDDWSNPTPAGRYHLVVIGGGTAGLVCAGGAAGLGARVALIERGLLGGDCLNTGCVPSKGVLVAGRAQGSRRAERLGIGTGGAVDFGAAMARTRRVRAAIARNDSAQRFADKGVDVFLGDARFVGPDAIEVGGATLRFRKAVIASGAEPRRPPIPGLDTVRAYTSEDWFTQTELPGRVVVIGAGPIGCEMAQAFARLGSAVVVLDVADRILGRDDPDASALLQRAMEADGVRFDLGVTAERVEGDGGRAGRVVCRVGAETDSLEFDALLVATGRRPRTANLGLEAAGVGLDDRGGLVLDDRLRTSNPRIYAAGDVAGLAQFTHAADAMARIVVGNALFRGRSKASALVVPWATYTEPEVAGVGLTAPEAAAGGIAVDTFTVDFTDVDRAELEGHEGFVRAHVRRGSDRLVGATVVGPHAAELVGTLSVLMNEGLGLGALSRSIQPYPSSAMALKQLGDAYNRTRLTPLRARLLARLLDLLA